MPDLPGSRSPSRQGPGPDTVDPTASVQVFAVEDETIQLTWPSLPGRELHLECDGRTWVVGTEPPEWYRSPRLWPSRRTGAGRAGPGALTVAGLRPGTTYDICLSGPNLPRRRVAVARTLPPPPGRPLARFATVSDCHIGERRLGFLGRLHDPLPRPPGLEPYPERCLTAALAEARRWGAERIVAKGDLTQHTARREIASVAELLRGAQLPVDVLLGNHDVRGPLDAAAEFAAEGLPPVAQPRAVDIPGLRIVFGHTPLRGRHAGAMADTDIAAVGRLVADAEGASMVALHHPPRRHVLETKYPPSLLRQDTVGLVDALSRTHRPTLVVAGHTHRNRRYRVGGITVAEVGSTKDYPGQWGAYTVYEGGLRQAVFRVEAPDVVAWTESTRRAIGGLWGWWSPGRLGDRCWTLTWPDHVTAP